MCVIDEERNYTVYIHINKINGKTYVGITSQEPKKRWKSNGMGYEGQRFYNAINKYGWDNFEHVILFKNKTKDEAEKLEILFIKILLSNKKQFGYNVGGGGEGTERISEEGKEMLSLLNSGSNHPQSKKIICDDKIFGYIGDCAEYYNIKVSTMRGWLSHKTPIPKEFHNKGLRYLYGTINPNIQTYIICDNRNFETVDECATYYNVDRQDMLDWLAGRKSSPLKFIKLKLRYSNKESKLKIKRKIYCDGKMFNTIKECSDYYKIDYNTMKSYLNGYCNMPDKFSQMDLKFTDGYYTERDNKAKSVICDSIVYDKVVDCAEFYNINSSTMMRWLREKIMPQKFIDLGLTYRNESKNIIKGTPIKEIPQAKQVICGDKIFSTIKDCSDYYGIKYHTFHNWLNNTRQTPQQYIDLGLRYYNPEVDGDIEQYEKIN